MLSDREAMRRAAHYAAMGNHSAAIELWRDVLTLAPDNAAAHAGLAHSLFALKRKVGATSEAKAALGLDPENTPAMMVLALVAWMDNQPTLAVKRLDHLLSVDPLAVDAHLLRAQMLRTRGRNDEARDAVLEALTIDPDFGPALIEQGWIARAQGDTAQADAIARQRIAMDPDDVEALVLLGHVRRDARDVNAARELALAALSVNPRDSLALSLLAWTKTSQNPMGGVIWHMLRGLNAMQELTRIALLTLVYFGYLITGTLMRQWDVPQIYQIGFMVVWLVLGIGIYLNVILVEWLVKRELQSVRLTERF